MLTEKQNFTELREMAGLSVKEAAQVLGVHLRTVYRYENGETIPNALGIRRMTELANVHARKSRKTKFQFIDLFAGIGGLRRPFEEIGGECVFTAEWDSNCRKTYAANF